MNLNPFDLRGPEFLLFYGVLAVCSFAYLWRARRERESGSGSSVAALATELAQDPYQVAFLRGGRAETLRVAVISLLERGLLKAKGDRIQTAKSNAVELARKPLDKAILTKFETEDTARSLYTDTIIKDEADVIGDDLKDKKLLPDAGAKAKRNRDALTALAILWGVAGIKILVAFSRGRHNVLFLILIAVVAAGILLAMANRPRTVLGNQVSERLKLVFARLRDRRETLQFHQTSSELAFLAAAFGMAALPVSASIVVSPLRLQPARQVGSTGWSSCGSSCSSASSCSGGSSCGGGGCGGGCGGCGGG
jgi:uncharacterized protein (TIGR04222 family)